MALNDVIQNAVATAHSITQSLQEDVSFYAWKGQDGYGTEEWADLQTVKALVEQEDQMRQLGDGRLVKVRTKLTLLSLPANTTPNSGKARVNPVDPRDKFVMADGSTGPILNVVGLRNPGTAKPYLLEIWLGEGGQ